MKSSAKSFGHLRVVVVTFLVIFAVLSVVPTVYAAGVLSIDVNINGDPATVETNEIIEYVIDFSCSGTTTGCGELTIDFPIDADTQFVEVITATGYTGVQVGGVIRITDNDFFNDGDASQAIVRVRSRIDLTGGEPIDVTVTGTITDPAGPPTVNQSAPTVVVNPPTEQWSVIKSQILPAGGIGPAENGQATYQVQFCPDSNIGNILLNNVTMVDTYPPGVIVIDTDGGVDNGTSITWNLGNLTPDDPCQTRTVTLEFPTPNFVTNDTFNNLVEGFGENTTFPPVETCTAPNCIGSDTFGGTIDPPEANPGQGKSGPGSGVTVSPGGSSVFTLTMDLLEANVPVEDVILTDTLPKAISDPTLPAFEFVNINSGQWDGGVQASIEYSTNDGGSWTSIGVVDGSSNVTFTATTDFPVSPAITDIRWVFDPSGVPPTLPAAFTFTQNPSYRFIPHPSLQPIDFDDGVSTPPSRSYDNCVTTTYIDPATGNPASTGQDCDSVLLSEDALGYANVIPSKTVTGSPVDVLGSMQFTLTATMTQEGSGAIINPSFEDILPPYLILDTGTPFVATFNNFTTSPGQPYLVTQAVGPDTQLVFYWDDTIRPGSVDNTGATPVVANPMNEPEPFAGSKTINITFTVDVALNAPSGAHDNNFVLVSDSPNQLCQGGISGTDGTDIDDDLIFDETVCSITTEYQVREAAAMLSQKWDRSIVGPFGFLDSNNLDNSSPACPTYTFGGNSYTRFPCVAQGTPGGAFEAAYVMQNAGLVRVNNYIMYDVLPHIGDTGVAQALAGEARDSEFTALLTGPVVQQNALTSATFVIEYNTDPNYNGCRPEMSNTADESGWQPGCNNIWVDAATIGTAWDTVTAFRIRQTGGQIAVGETVVFLSPLEILDYVAPIDDDDAETGEIAWNSFAQRFNNFESGSRLLTAEPRKVGIIVVERYSVGNRVWIDDGAGTGIANNGVLDGSEAGIDGVLVQLLDSGGNVIDTDTTHEGGYYIFDDLPSGTYSIRIPASEFVATAPLEDYVSSTGNSTNNTDSNDNGIDPGTIDDYSAGIRSNTFTLSRDSEPIDELDLNINGSSGEGPAGRGSNFEEDEDSDLTIDFGFYRPMSIGNRVWFDTGAGANTDNGVIDADEINNGVDGVDINLYYDANEDGAITGAELSTPFATTTTANGGYYLFDLLTEGTYMVQVAPSAFAFGTTPATDGPLARYITSTGNAGDTEVDRDDNGIDPATEGDQRTFGVFSPLILLEDDAENDTETDKDGANPNPDGRRTDFDSSELTVDFGFFQQLTQMSLGNRVWIDDGDGVGGVANDGLINGGEVGIDGVVLNLYFDDNSDGVPDDNGAPGLADDIIDTQTTINGGYYLFDSLDPGRYIVQIPASNWTPTTGALENYFSSTVTTATENVDSNDNGIDQASYPAYVANGLLSNTIQLVPQGEPVAGDDDSVSGIGNADGDNNSDNTVDFGFYKLMSIGNRVWLDQDNTGANVPGDGIFDSATENGIDGVLVELYRDDGTTAGVIDAGDTFIGTDTTTGGGYYLFDGLSAGQYIVRIPASNFDNAGDILFQHFSSDGVDGDNTDDAADNDDNGEDDLAPQTNGIVSEVITLTQDGETILEADKEAGVLDGADVEFENSELTVDFGFFIPPMSIGNRVWYDDDGDGIYEPADGEVGIDNVTVELFLDDGDNTFDAGDTSQGTTLTASGGYYLFENLPPGTYFVRINGSNFSGTLVNHISTLTDPTPDDTTNLDDNGQDPATFADYATAGVISNPITLAANSEPTVTDEVVIDFNGRGSSGEEDIDSNLTVDFGFFVPMSIGNQVWRDNGIGTGGVFNNGVRDGTEAGIANVVVNLLRDNDGDGTPETVYATTTTDAQGYYLFDGLPEGTYQIVIPNTNFDVSGDPLFGLLSSFSNTADDTTDLNDNGIDDPAPETNGIVSNIFVMELSTEPTDDTDISSDTGTYGPNSRGLNGELNENSNLTLDFGFNTPPMSIGNLVWIDLNNSGTVDAADGVNPGRANVVVSLYDDTNGDGTPDNATPLATDTTDSNGYYLFENLQAGNYVVGINASNFAPSGPLEGYGSSTSTFADDVDINDNGINSPSPVSGTFGILSNALVLTANLEPTTDTDVSNNAADGPVFRGNNGEEDNDSDLSVDFGFFKSMSIGNRVWFDTGAGGGTYNDGIQNGSEPGAPNVNVTLYRDDGDGIFNRATDTVVDTDITDGTGHYLFDGLVAGNYFVWVDDTNFQAGGQLLDTSSSAPENGDNGVDIDDNGVNGLIPQTNGIVSNLITLAQDSEVAGETDLSGDTVNDGPFSRGINNEEDDNSDLTVDFGFITPPGSIGNRVWLDLNNNGIIDVADGANPGLPNVTVQLYRDANNDSIAQLSEIIATDVTDANGYYLFDGLPPDFYFVGIGQNNFRTGGNLIDYFSSTGSTASDTNIESDDNGIDNANPPIGGILSDRFELQPNTEPIADPPGVENDYSNNAADGPNFWGNNNEEDDDSNITIDFGLYKPMSVGNRVWFDTDDSGTINGTETGVPNVVVNLYRDNDGDGIPETLIDTDTTDASGYYLFDNLIAGTYFVEIENTNFDTAGDPLFGLSSSTVDTTNNVDRNDNGINDPTPEVNGIRSNIFTLSIDGQPIGESDLSSDVGDGPNRIGNNGEADNNSNITIDFGFVSPIGSIGNRVWLDNGVGGGTANNGVIDGAEAGIGNVVVSLYRDDNTDGVPDGAAIDTDTTNTGGYYLFDGLAPGNYLVALNLSNFNTGQPLGGLISSTGNVTDQGNVNDDRTDNGIDTLDPVYGILSSTMNITVNAEVVGETDLSNDPTDGPNFRGNNGEEDDDSDLTVDFGLFRPISLGNRVWFDTDDSGTINGSEIGIGGVTVSVYLDADLNGVPDSATPVATDTTDGNGYYLFEGLAPGSYVVAVDVTNFNAGQALESLSSSTGNTTTPTDRNDNGLDTLDGTFGILSNTITLTQNSTPTGETDLSNNPADGPVFIGNNGENDTNSDITVDFGFTGGLMSIGNRVWIDEVGDPATDRDGIFNGTESAVAGVDVSLYLDSDSDGVPDGAAIDTDTTNANGYYLFDGLAPGNYIVGLDSSNFSTGGVLRGYTSTTDGAVDTDNNDNGVDGNTPQVTGILSNTIVLMMNTEPTTDTDLSGDPTDGPNSRGNNGEEDDDSNLTVDFGVYKPLSIGNRVWFDPDDNGLIGATENGIANVAVTLYLDDGDGILDTAVDTPVDTDVTDGDGYYLFDNLTIGDYFVWVDDTNFLGGGALAGFSSSTGSTTNNVDSNDNGDDTGVDGGIASNLITLAFDSTPTGESDLSGDITDGPSFRGNFGESDNNSNLTVDFGFVAGAMSIGNQVWLDDGAGGGTANNGVRDGGEAGIPGVVVNLYADTNGDGTPDGGILVTDTTDANGYYLFDGRAPGQYVVQIAPSNFQSGGALNGLFSSTGDSATDVDLNDNGVDSSSPSGTGILSRTITLVADGAPTGESDFSNDPSDGPLFIGNNGENDPNSDIMIDFGFVARFDWGDAPDDGGTNGDYGTLDANNGPRHRIISSLFLGATVDDEDDGQESVNADGDGGDEDGVVIPSLVAGVTINVEVTVFNDTGSPANLVGWIDFDGDGTFDSGEGVSLTVPSDSSFQVVQLPFDVPIDADTTTGGTTYARFRLTTDSITTSDPLGLANDGEIEDYRVDILAPGLSVTKTDSANSIVVGQSTTYIITIDNSGGDVDDRNFQDNIPMGNPNGFDPATVTWTCTATGGASCIAGVSSTSTSGTGVINVDLDIPRDGQIVFELTGTLRGNFSGTQVVNTAGFTVGGPSATDTNGVIFDPPSGVKTGVVLDGGTRIRWTMTWINTGGAQAATVSDTLQAGQTFDGNLTCNARGTSTTTSCTFGGGVVSWSGVIGTGNANRVDISFDVAVSGGGRYRNTATIDINGETDTASASVRIGDGDDDDDDDDADDPVDGDLTVVSNIPPPSIVKLADPPFSQPGGVVNWTITVTNNSGQTINDVVISDDIPADLTVLNSTSTSGVLQVTGQSVILTQSSLQPGESIVIILQTRIAGNIAIPFVVNNTAKVSCFCSDESSSIASVISALELPATGETPFHTRNIVVLITILSMGTALVGVSIQRKRRETE